MCVAYAVVEWFEMKHRTGETISLAGWRVSDGGSDLHLLSDAVVLSIEPQGYAVLGREADMALNGGVAVDYACGAEVTLANGGDSIHLVFAGAVVDSVT